MKCEKCGTFLMDGTDFCTSCGAPTVHGKFADVEPPAPPSVTPVSPPSNDDRSKPLSEGSGIVWAVAGAVILIAALMFIYIDTAPWSEVEPDAEKTTINLANPVVRNRTIADEKHWDAVISIDKISPKNEQVLWDETRLVVKSSNGTTLHAKAAMDLDDPLAYDDGSDGKVSAQFWYVETATGDVYLDAGNSIRLTGLSEEYEGAHVSLVCRGETIGYVVLPSDFH